MPSTTRRAAIARSRPAGSRGYMTGTGIPGRVMAPFGPDPGPILGDGWTQLSPSRFVYEASAEVSPTLEFPGAIPGLPYRVVTLVRKWTGTGLVSVQIGSEFLYNLTDVGLYDLSLKAPIGGTSLVYTVQTNATVSIVEIEVRVARGL